MAKIKVGNEDYILVAKNSDFLQWVKINGL